MIALAGHLTTITVSILVGRIATQPFRLTGLSHEAVRLQARSALTGTGFTTREKVDGPHSEVSPGPTDRVQRSVRKPVFPSTSFPGDARWSLSTRTASFRSRTFSFRRIW